MSVRDQETILRLGVGPHQSVAIGPMRLNLETDGEQVLRASPEVGYLHRGIEKAAEKMPWLGVIPYTDRIDYVAGIHNNLAYCLAVESLAQISVPARAQAIRVVASELNRIGSHLLNIGNLARFLGARTVQFYALRDREKINNLFEMLCGARLTCNYIRFGGVSSDVTEGFVEKTNEFIDYLVPQLKEYHDLLSHNQIFIGRLANVGVVDPLMVERFGITGPTARAAGLPTDVRRLRPYCGYEKYDFAISVGSATVGSKGDSFDRYLVRIHEIEQSAKIIRQALNRMPDGSIQAQVPRVFKPAVGTAYAAVESPRGCFGVYVESVGEKYPSRVRFRTPSFAILGLLEEILRDVPLSDVGTIVTSFDIIVSEVDR